MDVRIEAGYARDFLPFEQDTRGFAPRIPVTVISGLLLGIVFFCGNTVGLGVFTESERKRGMASDGGLVFGVVIFSHISGSVDITNGDSTITLWHWGC